MRIRLLAGAAILGALFATGASASTSAPTLHSVSASHRHVVALYSLGIDLAPGRIVVASRARTAPSGKFVQANIRINEPLSGKRAGSLMRMQTRHTVRPGRYYVEVSGTVIGLDCTPKKPCRQNWSNIRRVLVR
jgi:hypothetical protein